MGIGRGLVFGTVAALISIACGAANAHSSGISQEIASPAQPGNEVADSKHMTEFQKSRLLGHYSTEDGKSGFVLDRTSDPPKARLDGDTTIESLGKKGSVTGAVEFISADKRIWLRVDQDSGDVMLFQGPLQHQGVPVVRDADAQQLR